ncbi:MAG: hypothetical protein AAF702_02680 [Chloroflexota bacterium]
MMITCRDYEVSQLMHEDALRRAERERLLLQVLRAYRQEPVPYDCRVLVLIGEWLIALGELLQRRYRFA